jgi:ankyrin repeat protein
MSTYDWKKIKEIITTAPDSIKKIWEDDFVYLEDCDSDEKIKELQRNPDTIIKKLTQSNSLFKYFVDNNYFNEADVISMFVPILEESNLHIITNKINCMYEDIIKIMAMDLHIIIFEQYIHKKKHPLSNPNAKDYSPQVDDYRRIITQKLKEIIKKEYPSNVKQHPICIMLYQYKFLENDVVTKFYDFLESYGDINTDTIKLKSLLKNFYKITKLIRRLINEYYLHLIKHQVIFINEICNNSRVVVKEQLFVLLNKLLSIPYEYVDFKHADKNGHNIPMLLINLPLENEHELIQIYQHILSKRIPYDHKDKDGNTIFHLAAFKRNKIFFEKFVQLDHVTPQLIELINCKNDHDVSVFDIIIENKQNVILSYLICYVSNDILEKIIPKIINCEELINILPDKHNIDHVFIPIITEWIEKLVCLKKEIVYEISVYKYQLNKICSLMSKIMICFDQNHPNLSAFIKWLILAIRINEMSIVNIILLSYHHLDDTMSGHCLSKCHKTLNTSPLIECIKMSNILVLKKLLSFNANLYDEDKDKKTAIMHAIDKECDEILNELLLHLNKVNVPQINKNCHQTVCYLIKNVIDQKLYLTFSYLSIRSYFMTLMPYIKALKKFILDKINS